MNAQELFEQVLEAANGDIAAAMSALEDGEYLETLFPTPDFECDDEAIEYAESEEKANTELVEEVYEMLKQQLK